MHYSSIEYLEKNYQFWEVFSGNGVSCRFQSCKPEPDIYAYLLKTYGLAGTAMVFIDDLDANLAAGAALGMGAKNLSARRAARSNRGG